MDTPKQCYRFIAGSSSGLPTLCTRPFANQAVGPHVLHRYPKHDQLTSVHVNCDDSKLLISGYSTVCSVTDIETGAVVREYRDIHTNHINISRFSTLNTNVFATSSFDGWAKVWDLRMKQTPVYEVNTGTEIVILSFSRDDMFLLTASVDNEVRQYFAVDGSDYMRYNTDNIKLRTGTNFIRAYFNASASNIFVGSCEEDVVRVLSTTTGNVISEVHIEPPFSDDFLYIQVSFF